MIRWHQLICGRGEELQEFFVALVGSDSSLRFPHGRTRLSVGLAVRLVGGHLAGGRMQVLLRLLLSCRSQ